MVDCYSLNMSIKKTCLFSFAKTYANLIGQWLTQRRINVEANDVASPLIHVQRCFDVICLLGKARLRDSVRVAYIEYIYFLEVNNKYIKSIAVKKSVFSRVRSTSEIADIVIARDEIYLVRVLT